MKMKNYFFCCLCVFRGCYSDGLSMARMNTIAEARWDGDAGSFRFFWQEMR